MVEAGGEPRPGRAESKRESARPDAIVIGTVAFLAIAFLLSWMTDMLFLKELAISGAIILMAVVFRSMERPKAQSGHFGYRQDQLN
jgi:hypothetical protein